MRPGRLLRQQMAPDQTGDALDRQRDRMAREMAVADCAVAYGVLTPENAGAAVAYQAERIRYHQRRLGVRGA